MATEMRESSDIFHLVAVHAAIRGRSAVHKLIVQHIEADENNQKVFAVSFAANALNFFSVPCQGLDHWL